MKKYKFFGIIIIALLIGCFSGSVFAVGDYETYPWHPPGGKSEWRSWGLQNGATLRDDGSILMAPESGECVVSLQRASNPKVNYEFEVEVKKFGNHFAAQIYTNPYRVMLYIRPDYIGYYSNTFPASGESKIPYPIGNDRHKYRVTVNGEFCELYIDDNYVTDFRVYQAPRTGWVQFQCDETTSAVLYSYQELPYPNEVSGTTSTPRPEVGPSAFRYDFNGGEDMSPWSLPSTYSVADGILHSRITSGTKARLHTTFPDDYVYEMRFRVNEISYGCFNMTMADFEHNKRGWLDIYRAYFRTVDSMGTYQSKYWNESIDSEWHILRYETFNDLQTVVISVDGKPVGEYRICGSFRPATKNDSTISEIVLGFDSDLAGDVLDMDIDWLSLEPKDYPITVSAPLGNAEFLEGQTITLSANVDEGADIPYVDYKINGKTVATGQAPNYEAVIENAAAGNYKITAEYENAVSHDVYYKVVPAISGEINLNGNEASLSIYDKFENVAHVTYLLDGVEAGSAFEAPYAVTLPELAPSEHSLTAMCYDANGVPIFGISERLTAMNGQTSTNYANDISYEVAGEDGSAVVELSNGMHKLYMTHTAEELSYLTENGTETRVGATGKWRIFTDGNIAEVYRNGQYVFSFKMPKTDEVNSKAESMGLEVKNFSVSIPEGRNNHFLKTNVNEQNAVYNIEGVGGYHYLDFTADKNDSFTLALSDGYFNNTVEFLNGEIYTMTTSNDSDIPYRSKIGDVPNTPAQVFYRVDTSVGMNRLYADGEFIGTFRGIHSAGNGSEGALGINVTGGDGLNYVAVNDYKDIYIYSDEFDGSGEIASQDFWQSSKALCDVDTEKGVMTLSAEDTTGISELNVSARDAEVSAELEIKECSGGFWFVLNHASTYMYTQMGYNYETGKFEMINVLPNSVTTVAEADGNLPIGEKITMGLKLRSSIEDEVKADLTVNGEPIFSNLEPIVCHGHIGFMIKRGSVVLDSFSYVGDSKPGTGVTEQIIDGLYGSYDAFDSDDEIILSDYKTTIRSSDGFKSYNGAVTTIKGQSEHVLQLKSGAMISIPTEDINGKYCAKCYISYDKGETWELQTLVSDDLANVISPNRVSQGASGRIYYTSGKSGSEETGITVVFYSDDDGRNWTRCSPLGPDNVGCMMAEAKTVEVGNETRCYFRSERGAVLYIVSYDRGETWSYDIHTTPFFSATNCFNVENDPYDLNVLYFAWGYDNAFSSGRNQVKRQRVAFARSYDGGKNWKFLETAFENDYNNFPYSWDDSMIMNTCINVLRDYVLVHSFRMRDYTAPQWSVEVVAYKKDELRDTDRFEQCHFHYPSFINATRFAGKEVAERSLVLDKTTNNVWFGGTLVKDALYEGKLSAPLAAAYAGVSFETAEDGSAVFRGLGDEVTVPAGDTAVKEGIVYISPAAFAEAYGLNLCDTEDVVILTSYGYLSDDEVRAFRYAANPLLKNVGGLPPPSDLSENSDAL